MLPGRCFESGTGTSAEGGGSSGRRIKREKAASGFIGSFLFPAGAPMPGYFTWIPFSRY
jgi:hypothetical protein